MPKLMSKLPIVAAVLLVAALVVPVALSSRTPRLGPVEGRLRPCKEGRPNQVSSQAEADAQRIPPLALPAGSEPYTVFRRFVEVLDARRDARLVQAWPPPADPPVPVTYAHLEFVTPYLRFRDDVELLLDPAGGVIHVRSSSRVGYSDLGANRARVEALRPVLAELR